MKDRFLIELGKFEYYLTWAPVKAGSVSVFPLTLRNRKVLDSGDGKLLDSSLMTFGTINYTKGIVTIDIGGNIGTEITVEYQIEEPKMVGDIELTQILAKDVRDLTFELFEILTPLMKDKTGISTCSTKGGVLGQINCDLSLTRSYLGLIKSRMKEL